MVALDSSLSLRFSSGDYRGIGYGIATAGLGICTATLRHLAYNYLSIQ